MTTLPAHIAGVRDGGRYITSGLITVRDPDTGVLNMSFHRMQIKGPRRLGILMVPRHLYLIYQKNEAKNKPTPISVIIGHHPMYYFAAAYTGPADLSELETRRGTARRRGRGSEVRDKRSGCAGACRRSAMRERYSRTNGRKKAHSQSSRITTLRHGHESGHPGGSPHDAQRRHL